MGKRKARSAHDALTSGEQLTAFLERIERVREEKREYSDEEKAILAEAKSGGFDTGAIRRLLKRREMKPHDLEEMKPHDLEEMEALDDVYQHAVGMSRELPLFKAIGTLSVDLAARESVVAALKQLVPSNGQITISCGGYAFRLWRDEDGNAFDEPMLPLGEQETAPRSASEGTTTARKRSAAAPEVDDDGARELGRVAARENVPVVRNPFPWDDGRRRFWDEGWREVAGSDGMGPSD